MGRRWLAHAVLAALVIAYVGLLTTRRPGEISTLLDGWGVNVIEFFAGALCLLAARAHGRGRLVPLLLGLGALSWAMGDVAATVLAPHTLSPPSPSLADAGYLGFFPCAYAAVALYTRAESRRIKLDLPARRRHRRPRRRRCLRSGGVPVGHRPHPPLTARRTAVTLAYPVGDVLLLLLVMGGAAAITSGRRRPWLLLGAAFAINAAR